jgi:Tfp pilus assembly protein FimT
MKTQTRGFSLIDLLVSMTVTSLLIMGMAQLMCHAILIKRKTDCSVRAAELACNKIEHLRTAAWSGEIPETAHSEELKDERVDHIFLRQWSIHDVAMETKQIELECFALNYPRKKTRLTLILSPDLGF